MQGAIFVPDCAHERRLRCPREAAWRPGCPPTPDGACGQRPCANKAWQRPIGRSVHRRPLAERGGAVLCSIGSGWPRHSVSVLWRVSAGRQGEGFTPVRPDVLVGVLDPTVGRGRGKQLPASVLMASRVQFGFAWRLSFVSRALQSALTMHDGERNQRERRVSASHRRQRRPGPCIGPDLPPR